MLKRGDNLANKHFQTFFTKIHKIQTLLWGKKYEKKKKKTDIN